MLGEYALTDDDERESRGGARAAELWAEAVRLREMVRYGKTAVISMGVDNPYGLPAPGTLGWLATLAVGLCERDPGERYVDAFRMSLWYGTTMQTVRRW